MLLYESLEEYSIEFYKFETFSEFIFDLVRNLSFKAETLSVHHGSVAKLAFSRVSLNMNDVNKEA